MVVDGYGRLQANRHDLGGLLAHLGTVGVQTVVLHHSGGRRLARLVANPVDRVRPALVADGIAECQVRWPTVPIVFCETRPLAEEWTYRYLAAAHAWADAEPAAIARIGASAPTERPNNDGGGPAAAEIRAWAHAEGLDVSDRGRIAASIRQAWARSTTPPDLTDRPHT